MGSPITFSGFNAIDFNVVLNAIMAQESAPLQALQAHQRELEATDTTYGQLVTKLDALRTSSGALSNASTLTTYAATSSDTTALTVSATVGAAAGRYEIKVNELARAQVTVSNTFAPDANTASIVSMADIEAFAATLDSLLRIFRAIERRDVASLAALTQSDAAFIKTWGQPAHFLVLRKRPGSV